MFLGCVCFHLLASRLFVLVHLSYYTFPLVATRFHVGTCFLGVPRVLTRDNSGDVATSKAPVGTDLKQTNLTCVEEAHRRHASRKTCEGSICKHKVGIEWLKWAGRLGAHFSQSASRPVAVCASISARVEETYLTTSPRGQEVTFPAFHLQGCRLSHSPRGRKQDETVLAASQFLISESPFVLLSCFPSFFF